MIKAKKQKGMKKHYESPNTEVMRIVSSSAVLTLSGGETDSVIIPDLVLGDVPADLWS